MNRPPVGWVEHCEALRSDSASAVGDPDLRREIKCKGLDISAVSGAEMQAMVSAITNAPADILRKSRAALGYE